MVQIVLNSLQLHVNHLHQQQLLKSLIHVIIILVLMVHVIMIQQQRNVLVYHHVHKLKIKNTVVFIRIYALTHLLQVLVQQDHVDQ